MIKFKTNYTKAKEYFEAEFRRLEIKEIKFLRLASILSFLLSFLCLFVAVSSFISYAISGTYLTLFSGILNSFIGFYNLKKAIEYYDKRKKLKNEMILNEL